MDSPTHNWPKGLDKLAAAFGVHTSYHDIEGKLRVASPEVLIQVLRELGAEAGSEREIARSLRERRLGRWERLLPHAAVIWAGRPAAVELRLPEPAGFDAASVELTLESGERTEWTARLGDCPVVKERRIGKQAFTARTLRLPKAPPSGFHRLSIQAGGARQECLLICAPRRAYMPRRDDDSKQWGVFLPLYALHSERSMGAGDFTDLEALAEWVSGLGGGVVATLPFLASFLDFPFDPSPYSPASRLFWNELYADPTRAEELASAPKARAILESAEFQDEMRALGAERLVDYRRLYPAKRRALEELASAFFAAPRDSRAEFAAFAKQRPDLEDYARFRAATERTRETWPNWPTPMRDGEIEEGDFDPAARDYHLYVQWLAHRQVESLATRAAAQGPGLYLDMTLGVSGDGYDVWRYRNEFARGVSAGAPPDGFFTKGQNWGFPPPHPIAAPEAGFAYWRAALRHHVRHAGILRLDHVMGLHRLYWIPQGAAATEGVYVRYPKEELYATLCLESWRGKCMIVGEDLGTVPPEVREAMTRRRLSRMYVGQFEATPDPNGTMATPARDCAAGMNTHDTPTFAAFWSGADIDDRAALGLLTPEQAESDGRWREGQRWALTEFLKNKGWVAGDAADPREILECCLRFLAASPARIMLVNLEDLWLEPEPQNTPGTFEERPNWRRRAGLSLEEFSRDDRILAVLKEIDSLRKEA